MTLERSTVELCRSIDLTDLPRERIWGEIEKLLELAEKPSVGLDLALELIQQPASVAWDSATEALYWTNFPILRAGMGLPVRSSVVRLALEP